MYHLSTYLKSIIAKVFITLLFCLLLTGGKPVHSQDFMHSLGISGLYSLDQVTRGGVTYSPRFNFITFSDHATISLGSHMTAWIDFWNPPGHTVHLPFLIEGNFGHAATREGEFPFGAFIGGGMGYNNMYGGELNDAIGPMATLGIRKGFDSSSWTTRFSFLFNMLGDPRSSVFAIGISHNFGDFD